VIYLDSSALVKLVFEESESGVLATWLEERHELPKITSDLSTVELMRVCRRLEPNSITGAQQVLAGVDLIPMSGDVVERAAVVGPPELRSLDAINLASAMVVSQLVTSFVVYDARLGAAAEDAGLKVVAPA
jgi:uncharacterized protein